MMQHCEHKNLKYFKETNKVVCLDCGMSFVDDRSFYPTYPPITNPDYPYTSPTTNPDYPYTSPTTNPDCPYTSPATTSCNR